MKKIKIGLPVIALLFAIVLSSFTLVDEKTDQSRFWYEFTVGDEEDPNDYVLSSSQVEPDCEYDETERCAVFALPHPTLTGKPDLEDEGIDIRNILD